MSALNLQINVGECSVTSTTKTFFTGKAPANQRLKIKGIEIFGKGTSNTDTPVKVEMGLITSDAVAGTTTPTTTPNDGDLAETPQGTYKTTYASEPTYGNIMRTWEVHPQTGLVVYLPLHDEIILKGGQEFGIRMTSNQAETMSLVVIVEE
jgi:hypothetical protein